MAQTASPITLKEETVLAFDRYVDEAEAGMKEMLTSGSDLPRDLAADRINRVENGDILAQFTSGNGPASAPHGLIHDWTGAVFVPAATIETTLELVQDYDNHKNIYKPDVMDSRLISRNGNEFKVYLRLLKKKLLTVVLDTDHDAHYIRVDDRLWLCHSYSTRIAEVEDPGTPKEVIREPDAGYGFLWRLYSYWRFQQLDNGMVIECQAISLTRDIPSGLGWIIKPIIRNLPRESLISTLDATRRALLKREASDAER